MTQFSDNDTVRDATSMNARKEQVRQDESVLWGPLTGNHLGSYLVNDKGDTQGRDPVFQGNHGKVNLWDSDKRRRATIQG